MTWIKRLPGPFHACSKLFELILQQDWDDVLFRLEIHPKEASQWENVGFDGEHETRVLPFHEACTLNAPLRVIEMLLNAYPEATHKKDLYFHRLPLHFACINCASPEVIRMLVTSYPDGAKVQDSLGRVPLHYAVFSHDSAEIIECLNEAFPDGPQVMDYKGWIPLHVACRHGSAANVLTAILKAYPRGVNNRTYGGMTPYECALKFHVLTDECVDILRNWTEKAK